MFLPFLAFFAIALPDGLFAVSWPSMRLELGVPLSALGIMLPLAVVASILSSSATGFVLGRVGIGWLLAVSTAMAGAAIFIQGLATAFWVVVAGACLFGAGSGAIDAGLNAHVARRFKARQITWLHACFGLGAACGPLVVAASTGLGLSWRWAFVAVAAVQGTLASVFALTARGWSAAAQPPAATQPPTTAQPPPRKKLGSVPPAALPGIVLFAVHNGLETTTSLWAFVYLTAARGIRPTTAALLVSGYWLALLVGRIVLGPLADRTGARPMLLTCLGGIVVGAGLLFLPGSAGASGVLVLGFAVAPVFPLLTLTTKDRVGEHHADRVIGLQVAAGSAGATALPALVGLLMDRIGAGVLAPCLVVLSLVTLATYLAITARSRRLPPVVHEEPRSTS